MNRISRLDYWCQLRPHPQGAFGVGDARFMPEWPRCNTTDDNYEQVTRALVFTGIEEANKVFSQTSRTPRLIEVRKYSDGKTSVMVRE